MSDFFQQVKNEPEKLKHKSHFRRAFEALPEEDREDFVKAVLDTSIPLVSIKRVLDKRGIKISVSSIARARNGEILDGVI